MKSLVNKNGRLTSLPPKLAKLTQKKDISRKSLAASQNKNKTSSLLTMVSPLAFQFTKTHEQTFTKR
jgi:hypothetical protein